MQGNLRPKVAGNLLLLGEDHHQVLQLFADLARFHDGLGNLVAQQLPVAAAKTERGVLHRLFRHAERRADLRVAALPVFTWLQILE